MKAEESLALMFRKPEPTCPGCLKMYLPAQMFRIEASGSKIRFGILKGKAKVYEDFDAPLPDDLLSEFEANRCGS